jgi:hypothetical protein
MGEWVRGRLGDKAMGRRDLVPLPGRADRKAPLPGEPVPPKREAGGFPSMQEANLLTHRQTATYNYYYLEQF